ncbi:MAG: helix-turn-helix domain-containing protein, partial [Candidatus Dormibacteraceae bacterium]
EQLIVAGPDTRATLSEATGRRTVGLRFAPGVGPAVFRVGAHELRDRRLPLDELWNPADVRRLTERLAAGAEPAALLEAAAHDRVRSGLRDPASPWVAEQLSAGRAVTEIARRLGITERHLHRRSLDAFGYGPKMLQRVLRLQRALALVRGGTPAAIAALDAGYADQTHLAHDVRALAGVPLRAVLSS